MKVGFRNIRTNMVLMTMIISGVLCAKTGIKNGFGEVINIEYDRFSNAITEHVKISSQEHTDSFNTIIRNGMLVRYSNAKANILICHGFMCNQHDVQFLRRLFHRGDYNIMTFDFRAHGQNITGQHCTLGRDEAFDALAAAQFIKQHPDLKGKPLFVYGFSMGAVAAIEAQAKNPSLFDAMILDCPFDSSENIVKRGLKHLKLSLFGYEFEIPGRHFLQKYAFHPYVQELVKLILKTVSKFDSHNVQMRVHPVNPVRSAKHITVPSFFIHCKNDTKVTTKAIQSVFTSAQGIKRLWLTNGRQHYDSFFYNPEKYTEKVRGFLDEVLSGHIYAQKKEQVIVDEDDEVTRAIAKKGDKYEAI